MIPTIKRHLPAVCQDNWNTFFCLQVKAKEMHVIQNVGVSRCYTELFTNRRVVHTCKQFGLIWPLIVLRVVLSRTESLACDELCKEQPVGFIALLSTVQVPNFLGGFFCFIKVSSCTPNIVCHASPQNPKLLKNIQKNMAACFEHE
jgi:hypothetical protein